MRDEGQEIMMDHTVEGFELSPQQSRIWRRLRRDGAAAYQVQAVVPVGSRSPERLLGALRAAVESHEILRTVFHSLVGMEFPLQRITFSGGLDWSEHVEVENLDSYCLELRRQAFNLQDGPSLRARLVSMPGGDRFLLLQLPALCCDGPGLLQLAHEVLLAADEGSMASSPPDEEALQYADLAQWQNELLSADETAAGREVWRSMGISSLDQERLPGRSPGAGEGEYLPSSMDFGSISLPEECGEVWLLTCWRVLLARRGAAATLLGVAFDGRRYEELESTVGPLAKILPVSFLAVSGSSISDPVAITFSEAMEASDFCVEALRPWQESFTWSLFASEAGGANLGEDSYLPLGFEFQRGSGERSLWAIIDRFELLLQCQVQGSICHLRLLWDERFYDAAEVRRLGEGLLALAAAALQRPKTRVEELPVLGEGERRQLVGLWSGAGAAALGGGTVSELFERAVERFGDRRALVATDGELTFAELAQRSDRLAARMQILGVGADCIVGLPAMRHTGTLIGLLAILKAGAAYLPLEMSQPASRRSLLLRQAGARWLLGGLKDLDGLDNDISLISGVGGDADRKAYAVAARPRLGPESLAYLLFTSGTTGTPKGVAVSHGQLTRYAAAAARRLGFLGSGTYAVVSTFAADLGNTMIFPALLGGGCLLLVSEEQLADARRLAAIFEETGVDYLKIVPSHLAALLEVEDAQRLLPRRALVCGGEALPADLLKRIASLAPELAVFNHFGPTETTVGVIAGPVTVGDPMTLGRPLDGNLIFLTDARCQLVPLGLPGEILVGGGQVARGYFGRPGSTAERFVPDPFSGTAGGRLYRTGDRARFTLDGSLEFLGRRDHQVKIRGFRVELGEIEGVLASHPQIVAAVVILHRDSEGREALVGYFETSGSGSKDAGPGVEEVRAFLGQHLPEYMVPAYLLPLEVLPRNANGKINRQALPEPRREQRLGPQRPPTPVEEMVLDLWRALLLRDEISLTDDFFVLGGHSLTAMQLTVRLGKAFGIQLAVDRIFEAPTPEQLAKVVEAALRREDGVPVPPLTRRPPGSVAPLSFSQERHWFLQQLDPKSPLYNIRGALRVHGALRVEVLEACFREILRRHELLRTAFPAREAPFGAGPSGDLGPVPEVMEVVPFEIPVIDLQSLDQNRRDDLFAVLAAASGLRPFAMDSLPLIRIEALRLGSDDHLLVLTFHHIVADRWTLNLLIREIGVLYPALSEGRPSPLSPLELQYGDFARWQRDWLQGAVVDRELSYWRRELAGAPEVLTLPQSRPRPPRPSGRSGRLPFRLARPVRDELQAIGRRQNMTLFQTLLALFQVLLHGFTGDEDIVVGSPIAGRNQIETEALMGCFINALALRARLQGDPSFIELLGRLRETFLGAYSHQDLPFERLVQEISPTRSTAVAPIFQVVFNYASSPVEPLELPGLVFSPWRPESVHDAKYDLILSIFNSPEGLESFLTYSSDLFDAASMERLVAQLQLLADRVVQRPDSRLSELVLGIRDEEQRARLDLARQLKGRRQEQLAGARRSAVGNLAKEAFKP